MEPIAMTQEKTTIDPLTGLLTPSSSNERGWVVNPAKDSGYALNIYHTSLYGNIEISVKNVERVPAKLLLSSSMYVASWIGLQIYHQTHGSFSSPSQISTEMYKLMLSMSMMESSQTFPFVHQEHTHTSVYEDIDSLHTLKLESEDDIIVYDIKIRYIVTGHRVPSFLAPLPLRPVPNLIPDKVVNIVWTQLGRNSIKLDLDPAETLIFRTKPTVYKWMPVSETLHHAIPSSPSKMSQDALSEPSSAGSLESECGI